MQIAFNHTYSTTRITTHLLRHDEVDLLCRQDPARPVCQILLAVKRVDRLARLLQHSHQLAPGDLSHELFFVSACACKCSQTTAAASLLLPADLRGGAAAYGR